MNANDIKAGSTLTTKEGSNTTSTVIEGSMYSEPKVISAKLIDGRIEIVKRAEPLYFYATYPSQQPIPKIWKEVYVATSDGSKHYREIVLHKVINATYIPAQPERWEFEE